MSQVATAMNQTMVKAQEAAITAWYEKNPWAAIRGIDEPTWNALCNTIYPGSKPDSVLMAVDYCRARGLDVMLKPVHLVPMPVSIPGTQDKEWRDVPMPGVGLYRIQASRSGDYAGADEPEFGPIVEQQWEGRFGTVRLRYPEWCKVTIYKLIGDRVVGFTAKEFWTENYATQSNQHDAPNKMWHKRPFGQLAKCTEAQALRKGWPEIGQEPTAEEMEGKAYVVERDVTPEPATLGRPKRETFPEQKFNANFATYEKTIKSGKKDAMTVIATLSSKYELTEEQENRLLAVEEAAESKQGEQA